MVNWQKFNCRSEEMKVPTDFLYREAGFCVCSGVGWLKFGWEDERRAQKVAILARCDLGVRSPDLHHMLDLTTCFLCHKSTNRRCSVLVCSSAPLTNSSHVEDKHLSRFIELWFGMYSHHILLSDPESSSTSSYSGFLVPGSLWSIVVQSKATEINRWPLTMELRLDGNREGQCWEWDYIYSFFTAQLGHVPVLVG